MEPEVSLLSKQEPATGPYPEPDSVRYTLSKMHPSQHSHIQFLLVITDFTILSCYHGMQKAYFV
jgi:hypothetical protein